MNALHPVGVRCQRLPRGARLNARDGLDAWWWWAGWVLVRWVGGLDRMRGQCSQTRQGRAAGTQRGRQRSPALNSGGHESCDLARAKKKVRLFSHWLITREGKIPLSASLKHSFGWPILFFLSAKSKVVCTAKEGRQFEAQAWQHFYKLKPRAKKHNKRRSRSSRAWTLQLAKGGEEGGG